jgi:hypothetical protein
MRVVLLESVEENCKLPKVTILRATGIHELKNEVKPTGLLLDEKLVKECHTQTEAKVNKIKARLEYSPQQVIETSRARYWHFIIIGKGDYILEIIHKLLHITLNLRACVYRDIIFTRLII